MFALFYKDKTGFTLPVQEIDSTRLFVFGEKQLAERALEDYQAFLESQLHPIIVYRRKNFFSKEMIPNPPLPEHKRELFEQQQRTIFIDRIKMYPSKV